MLKNNKALKILTSNRGMDSDDNGYTHHSNLRNFQKLCDICVKSQVYTFVTNDNLCLLHCKFSYSNH